jgi:hypothetical protein
MFELFTRIKLWFLILFIYSLIISYYSIDSLEIFIYYLYKFLGINLILTQLEDLTVILFELINYTLLLYFIPFTIFKLFLYFCPAFYKKEQLIFSKLIKIFLLGILLSFFLTFFNFLFIYSVYSIQLFDFNFFNSTQILVDLKKILFFFFTFFKYNLFFFLPFNLFFLFLINLIQNPFIIKNYLRSFNFFTFLYFYMMGFFPIDNYAQLIIYYVSQIIQLEVLILLEFLILYKSLRKEI